MQVAVFDTYVPKKEGGLMHFDILVEDSQKQDNDRVFSIGKEYIASKVQAGQPISTDECRLKLVSSYQEMLAVLLCQWRKR